MDATAETKVMGWQDRDRIARDQRGQSAAAKAYDAMFATAWAAAGGTEEGRQQATGSREAVACRRDIRPGDAIPRVEGCEPAAAVDVIYGGGTIAIAYVALGARGHAISRGTSGWYHPDYGTVPARRMRRLTRRSYRPPMAAPQIPA